MDRIDLGVIAHKVHRFWVRGEPGQPGHALLAVGQVNGGDWFVAKAEAGTNMAWVAAGEQHAFDVVAGWVRRRGGPELWQEIQPSPAGSTANLR